MIEAILLVIGFLAGSVFETWIESWAPCPRCDERATNMTRTYRCKCGERITEGGDVDGPSNE